jgi:Sensors of blue-light using FAD
MALLRLAYVSTSAIAGDPREPESIGDILMSSRRNNETAGITGALLVTGARFAQVLEGEQEAVEETYARITRDRRHVDIVLLLKEAVAERQFPQWSMAFIGPSQAAEEAVARVTAGLPGTEAGALARGLVSFMSHMLTTHGGGSPSSVGER